MACRRAARDVSQRAQPDAPRKKRSSSSGRTVARRRGIRKTCRRRLTTPTGGRSASRTRSSRWKSRYKLPADGTIQYRVLLHPDQLHRAEVGEVDRDPSEQPRSRAPRARLLPRQPRTCSARRCCRPECAALGENAARGERRHQPRKPPDQGLPPRRLARDLRAGDVVPDRTRKAPRSGSSPEASSSCRCTTRPRVRRRRDRTKVGLTFAKEPCAEGAAARGSSSTARSRCRPAPPTSRCKADAEFLQDATVWGIFPHTHLRGKKWDYKLVLPDGTSEDDPVGAEATTSTGRRTTCSRSRCRCRRGPGSSRPRGTTTPPGNKSNPDPKVDVKWGDQTWEEMQYTGVLFTPSQPPTPIVKQ